MAKPNPENNLPPEDINYLLRKAGCMQLDIIQETGVSQAMVSQVVNSQSTSVRVMDAIARKIKKLPWEIWPDTYAGDRDLEGWEEVVEDDARHSI